MRSRKSRTSAYGAPRARATGAGRLESCLASGRLATVVEARPPDGASVEPLLEAHAPLLGVVDAVHLTDAPRARPHQGNLAGAAALLEAGFDVIASRTCRDRNRIALQGDLLAAAALGVTNMFFVRGDPPSLGDHPSAPGVYDLSTVELLGLARRLCREGRLDSGRPVAPPPELTLAAAVAVEAPDERGELARAADKLAAGADFLIAQPVFSLDRLEAFTTALGRRVGAPGPIPLLAGVAVPDGLEALDALDALDEVTVPTDLRSRFERTPRWRQDELGCELAVETIRAIDRRGLAAGVALYPFTEDPGWIAETVAAART